MIRADRGDSAPPEGLPRSTLRILAVVSFSLAAAIHRVELSAICALVGLILIGWSMFGKRPTYHEKIHVWAGLGALAVIGMSWISRVGPPAPSESTVYPVYQGLLIGAILVALVRGRTTPGRRLAVIVCLGSVALVTVWILASEWDSAVGTDVYLAHEGAGQALRSGENPYGEEVRFPDGNPYTPSDAVVVGYPYPPPVLASYAVAAGLGDARIISAVAWLALLTLLSGRSLRTGRAGDATFATLLVLSAAPVWPVMVFVAWTEPLSLLLLFGAILLWKRSWGLSSVLLGLALASKQYYILLLPLLLLMRVDNRLQRILTAGATALIVLMPPLIIDPEAYLDATVSNLLAIAFRPDSQSLSGFLASYGIEFMVPRPLWVVLIVGVGATLARKTRTRSAVAFSFVLVLGLAFWTGLAFPNYWFLITGLTATGLITFEADAEALRVRKATILNRRAASPSM